MSEEALGRLAALVIAIVVGAITWALGGPSWAVFVVTTFAYWTMAVR